MNEALLASYRHMFLAIQKIGAGALAQLSYEDLVRVPGAEMNSIAVIVQHLHGNMLSRWTDFLTTDGEKPGRDRDAEFEAPAAPDRAAVLAQWEAGWACVNGALAGLTPDDLARTVTIRGQPHAVFEAIHRQIQHYSYHVGQLVTLARLAKGAEWKTLSIPKGQSKQYTPRGLGGEAAPRA